MEHRRYKKIMVANRGEIAIRVLRAASELKLRTVAVYTYEDRYSLHRYKADESYQIGPDDEPLQPYLSIEEIIKVAKRNEVDAIHPGYGFLSENVHFARRCSEENIIFIGPRPEAMEKMGDKVQAKTIAQNLNIPVIPDNVIAIDDMEALKKEAGRIGYPVVVKAIAGGGGRGMRVIRSEKDLEREFNEAKREAKTAFDNDSVFLEKFIENPKHIEVQILGDNYGNLVHLYERDCSVQRRFQKVVEVAPSLTIPQATLEKLYQYALDIGRSVKYNNAGTVEFLIDPAGNIYFIEINPRIQVEHTVTEEITGIDLVRSQILISMGYELSHPTIFINSQDDIRKDGVAIQCRITTEDPGNNFKPEYGTLIAYRSASGFGIRLDAGSAYPGSTISPFFDSLLVKVTAWGRTLKGASERMYRALSEFRVRGVKTNIEFLMNLVEHPVFLEGAMTVNFINDHPELFDVPVRRDRGTKILRYLAETIVNGHPEIKELPRNKKFRIPEVPDFDLNAPFPKGTKEKLDSMGPDEFCKWLKSEKKIHFTDTTFRDAHQSLLATRMRTYDMLKVAESFARHHGSDVFSMEVWGGATFDVAMRFLYEDPWARLQMIRQAIPNILLQMLLRGSNAVGYKAYPDNLIEAFIVKAWENGVDLFRIFDSLNWVESMKISIRTVREQTGALAEACICYTGDISDPAKTKYDLQYYIDMAQRLEDEGAHILGIKDMAGLLKPIAAEMLISALKEKLEIPIHLHTHDTSSIQAATYLRAIERGVDVIDVAISSLSGLTSQPCFNSIVAMIRGQERDNPIDIHSLNAFSNYWEVVREYYYPFETELRSGTASVYEHEIPGGQYSNLRSQARGLGLENQFERIKENYKIANELLGDIVKVTPSSKVVGDMAMFLTSNKLTKEDVLQKGEQLAFPESVKSFFRGDIGQPYGGFPEKLQKLILKKEKPMTQRPNTSLEPIDFERDVLAFKEIFGPNTSLLDFISYQLYPKVYEEFFKHFEQYGVVWTLPTPVFYYGLKENEEIIVEIGEGKNLLIQYLNKTTPDATGVCRVYIKLNGQARAIPVQDRSVEDVREKHRKAEKVTEVGAPLPGNLSKILVEEGTHVEKNKPLFVIEAMKMESTITAPISGVVVKIFLEEKTFVEQDDLVLELDPDKRQI